MILEPKSIILLTKKHHLTCKCPYRQIIEFILESINRKIAVLKLEVPEKQALKLHNVYDALNLVMCPKPTSEKYHNIDCVNKECDICRNTIDSLKEHYQKPIDLNPRTLKFKSWEYQDVQVNVRKENSFQVELRKRQTIIRHEKTFVDVLESLHKALDVPNIYTQTYEKTASLLLGKTKKSKT